MKKIELEIVALSHSITQTQNYAVILGEVDGQRRMPIVIGGFEAQAIAVAMEQIHPGRPLTHDLIKNIVVGLGAELKEVLISNLLEGIFYSKLICELNGLEIEVDSRTSDALALAIRFGAPIYTFDFIMEQAGIVLDEGSPEKEPAPSKKKSKSSLSSLSIEDLDKLLEASLQNEDYEQAAKIRDELKNRKGS